MARATIFYAVAFVGIFALCALSQGTPEQLSSPRLSERAQRALFPVANDPFKITANSVVKYPVLGHDTKAANYDGSILYRQSGLQSSP